MYLRKTIINLNFSGDGDGTQGLTNDRQRLYLKVIKNFWMYLYSKSCLGEKRQLEVMKLSNIDTGSFGKTAYGRGRCLADLHF